jgi:hypothetical protein
MKIKELYEAVAKLGFEDNLEDIPAFFHAAWRAMVQVNALRPLTAILEIYERVPENIATGGGFDIIEHAGEDLIVEAKDIARAYYFEAKGYGECRIEVCESDGTWRIVEAMSFDNTEFEAKRGFVKIDGNFTDLPARMRFIGEFVYHVRGCAFFNKVYSPREDDLPSYTELIRYDVGKLGDNFLAFADRPLIGDYNRLTAGYVLESNGVIRVPRELCSELKIKYKRLPTRLVYKNDPAEDEREIELDADLCELLPILVAAYIWADEGDGKYALYLELYRERAAEIERRERSREPCEYKLFGGW